METTFIGLVDIVEEKPKVELKAPKSFTTIIDHVMQTEYAFTRGGKWSMIKLRIVSFSGSQSHYPAHEGSFTFAPLFMALNASTNFIFTSLYCIKKAPPERC